jgi:ABC-type uncharacterized transport system substrate-binding protein
MRHYLVPVLLACASPAQAHPHMFVDTGLAVVFDDQGMAAGVRIRWTYDDLTSMQLLADLGMDPEMDGVLTEAELAALSGFDMHWDEGITGDTYALSGDTPLALSRPKDWTVAYDGTRLTSTHFRAFEAPVPVDLPLLVQAYDATMYTAYVLTGAIEAGRAGCQAEKVLPDLEAARAKLDAAIAALPTGVEADFPALGADFAEGIRVTCGAKS